VKVNVADTISTKVSCSNAQAMTVMFSKKLCLEMYGCHMFRNVRLSSGGGQKW